MSKTHKDNKRLAQTKEKQPVKKTKPYDRNKDRKNNKVEKD